MTITSSENFPKIQQYKSLVAEPKKTALGLSRNTQLKMPTVLLPCLLFLLFDGYVCSLSLKENQTLRQFQV